MTAFNIDRLTTSGAPDLAFGHPRRDHHQVACTVLIGRNTKSCQTLAERAVGMAVTTVEGASATTGPRFSMTRACTKHPGSPDSHPFGRAAAPAPLQRHGDGSRPSLTSPSVSPGTAP